MKQKPKSRHPQKFARQLLKSHLLVASIGLFMLLLSLTSTLYLRAKVVIMADEVGPALTSAQMLGHVQHSLAALRGWVSLGDKAFLVEWENAWAEGVEPALVSLIKLQDEQKQVFAPGMVAQLRQHLTELRESQWWVQDVAQTPGNEPAAVTYTFEVEPIGDTLDKIITAMLYETLKGDLVDKEWVIRLVEIQRLFSASRLLLEEIIGEVTLYHEHENDFHRNIRLVQTSMGELTSQPLFKAPELHRLSFLFQREFLAFERLADKAIRQRKSDKWNVAQYRMATETVSAAKQVVEILSKLTTNAEIKMHRHLLVTARATTIAVVFMVILIGIMILLATIISRRQSRALTRPIAALSMATQQLADGRLDHDIPVLGSDEVGELTQVFNSMRISLTQARGKLLATNMTLEQRVRERTEELDSVNKSLRQEITERQQAEKRIAASLKEKEILLREIHHRVKNNMQVLITLLKLQSDNANHRQYAVMLRDSMNRIRSMALIHEKLCRSEDLEYINFDGYVKSLVNDLLVTRVGGSSRITSMIAIQDISLDIDHAIACGLIINDLVSNSLKHAFPGDRQGEIAVSFRSINENEVELKVGDNGVGLPSDLDFRNTKSLGLHLVTILAEDQLDGKVELDRSGGARYCIRFTL